MEDTASTHIMSVLDNSPASVETPRDAMFAFMLACGLGTKDFKSQYTNKGLPARDTPAEAHVLVPQLNQNIAQIIFEMVQVESARMRERVGLVSPPQSPRQTEARRAPPAPTRPPRLAVSQASGQPLAAARELFGAFPAVVPDE